MSNVQSTDSEETGPAQHVDDVAIEAAKALLRKAVILRRDLRAASVRKADDAARFDLVRRRLGSRPPRVVAAYLSSGSEPGTLQLIAWLAAQGVRVLLPVMTTPTRALRQQAAWAPYAGPDALRVGVLSILEPTTPASEGPALADADLVICPALAANPSGDRLGRGGGWYDRALHFARDDAELWAMLNDDEVLNAIPTQPWDRRVGAIVTSSRIIGCRAPVAG